MKANKKIEKAVVSGYKAIEDGVVSGYKKIENKFVKAFLTPDDDADQERSETDNQDFKRSEWDGWN